MKNKNNLIFEDYELIIIEHALDFFKEYRGLSHEDYIDADKILHKIINNLYAKNNPEIIQELRTTNE